MMTLQCVVSRGRLLSPLVLAAFMLVSQRAQAVTVQSVALVVTSLDDSGPGTLRQALADAPNGQVITFAPSLAGGTITLASELVLNKSLVVQAPEGGLTLSGAGVTRVFFVDSVFHAVIEGFTIRDGAALGGGGLDGSGGAILSVDAHLQLVRCSLENNSALQGGGAIEQLRGTLDVVASTIADNGFNATALTTVSFGGGVRVVEGTATFVNSTVKGNSAMLDGGGIVNTRGTLTLVHTTVADNGARLGGGLLTVGGPTVTAVTTLRNSIVAHNFSETTEGGPDLFNISIGDIDPNAFTDVTATGSLIGHASGHNLADGGTNRVGVDAGFVLDGFGRPLLADNGGETRTVALTETSLAVDTAEEPGCLEPLVGGGDQRGVERPQGLGCDRGAFERQGVEQGSVLALSVEPKGTVNKTSGAAVVSGTVSCDAPTTVSVRVTLHQAQKQRRLVVTRDASATVSIACDGETDWAAAVGGESFTNGDAEATVEALDTDPLVGDSATVKLFWSR